MTPTNFFPSSDLLTLNVVEELNDEDDVDLSFGGDEADGSDAICHSSLASADTSLFGDNTISLPIDKGTSLTLLGPRKTVSEESCFYIDDALAELHVRLYIKLTILTCMQCYSGVAPANLDSHMRQMHKFLVPRSKVEILEIAKGYGVTPRAEDVLFPHTMDPIPDLATADGFYCSASGCHYAAQKHRTMIQHLRPHHQKGETALSVSCVVQIPFSSVGSYRHVERHSPSTFCTETTHVEEDIVILTCSFEQAVLDDNVIRMTRDPNDTPPWLERLYWPTLVHHVNPKVLVRLVSLPGNEEACLTGVRQALFDYFEWIGAIIRSDRFTTTLKHLHTAKENE